jgi:tRNA dimethylallyltransferase
VSTGAPVALVGPTAAGKSSLALRLARLRSGVEIVSVDSMAVYRKMDVGTAKPSLAAQAEVPYHMLDVCDPDEDYSVLRYQRGAQRALCDIVERGRRGLYMRALVDRLELPGRFPEVAGELEREAEAPGGLDRLHARLEELDPVAAARTTSSNRRRIVRALEVTIGSGRPFSSFGPGLRAYPPTACTILGIPFVPEIHDALIERRFDELLSAGLVEEVRSLARRPEGLSRTARQALGYREVLAHVEEGVPLQDALSEAVRRTKAYARRQWAWNRRDPRIRWLDPRADLLEPLLVAWDEMGESRNGR